MNSNKTSIENLLKLLHAKPQPDTVVEFSLFKRSKLYRKKASLENETNAKVKSSEEAIDSSISK
jgi:hypothetical protein